MEEDFKDMWVKKTKEENGIRLRQRRLGDLYIVLPEPLGFGIYFLN